MSETVVVAIVAFIGVIVGNILTFIPTIFQRNQEKVKFQKDIFEARFTKLEEQIEKYMYKLNNLRDAENPSKVIMSFDDEILALARIANDYWIDQAVNELVISNLKLSSQVNRESDDKKYKVGIGWTFPVRDACTDLLVELDKFRLNDYKPRKKPRAKISDWLKDRSFLNSPSKKSK